MPRRRGEETVLPGAHLLAEAEQLAAAMAAARPFYGPSRPGQFWLRVPSGRLTFAVRLLVPPPTDTKQPLVIALHGAGGSENLFFDSYGDGEALRQCEQRGWYLCAPRAGLGVPDLPALVDALAQRYPIDVRRVLLVGHSMGAAMAVGAASAAPERFAAVAALGGGGDVRDSDALRRVPFFVATGSRDFLRAGALRLHERLQQPETRIEWREYAGVEHWSIVQIALPDVFTWFDAALAR
jgi:predicted esterase